MLSLSFPGWDAGWLAWIALAPFLFLMMTPRRTRDYWKLSAAFGLSFYAGVLYWLLAMHPLDWLGFNTVQSLALVTFCWLAASAICGAVLTAATAGMGRLLRSYQRAGRGLHAAVAVLLPALLWVALEWLQSLGPFGLTWGSLALSQYQYLPLLQGIAWVGPFALTGLIVAVNAAIAHSMRTRRPTALIATLGTLLVWSGAGLWWMNRPIEGKPFRAAVVQGNISQTEKWSEGNEFRILNTYLELSRKAEGAALVIWPETALPVIIQENYGVWDRMLSEARQRNQHLMTGSFYRSLKDGVAQPQTLRDWNFFNAVTVFSPGAGNLGFDFKRHLVPFGEYQPGRGFLPNIMGALNILPYDTSAGEKPNPFTLPFGVVGAGVCFDSYFPQVIRETTNAGAEVLVLVTNDAWYKKTAAPHQHLAQGVLRAVENHRYFLQSANTGVSGIVDPTGRIVARSGLFVPEVIEGDVVPLKDKTPYSRHGDWLPMLAALGVAAMGLRAWRKA